MAGRELPNIGLTGYWPLGDDTWKDGMDENMLRLSVLGQLVAESFVVGEPAGAQGKVVLTQNAAPIGIYDNGAWHYVNAKEGWTAWVKSEDALYVFDGAAWVEVTTAGGGGGGGALPPGGAPGQVLMKTGGADGAAGWNDVIGRSAYQEAVANGFVGTAAEWLASLEGPPGADSEVPGPPGLGVPAGGTTGQVLAKTSNADNATAWTDPEAGSGVPDGGTTGQVLAKVSNDDGDADWIDPPEGGGGGGLGFIDTIRANGAYGVEEGDTDSEVMQKFAVYVAALVPGGGSGGGPWEYARVRMRRDYINGAYPNYTALNEVYFETSAGAGRLPGTWTRTDVDTYIPPAWIDGNTATGDERGGSDFSLVCHFTNPSDVRSMSLVSHGYASEFPNIIDISVSHDGVSFVDKGNYSGQTSDAAGQLKSYALAE